MNIPVIFHFLKEVSANNNREWFNAHKDLYEEARYERSEERRVGKECRL